MAQAASQLTDFLRRHGVAMRGGFACTRDAGKTNLQRLLEDALPDEQRGTLFGEQPLPDFSPCEKTFESSLRQSRLKVFVLGAPRRTIVSGEA